MVIFHQGVIIEMLQIAYSKPSFKTKTLLKLAIAVFGDQL